MLVGMCGSLVHHVQIQLGKAMVMEKRKIEQHGKEEKQTEKTKRSTLGRRATARTVETELDVARGMCVVAPIYFRSIF